MEKYHVLEMIGEGSFGRVYKGRRKHSAQVRREVAGERTGGPLCGTGNDFWWLLGSRALPGLWDSALIHFSADIPGQLLLAQTHSGSRDLRRSLVHPLLKAGPALNPDPVKPQGQTPRSQCLTILGVNRFSLNQVEASLFQFVILVSYSHMLQPPSPSNGLCYTPSSLLMSFWAKNWPHYCQCNLRSSK